MFTVMDKIGILVPVYLLVFGRMSSMMVTMPILGYSTIPVRVRIIIAFIFTLIVAPMLVDGFSKTYVSFWPLAIDMGREIILGLMLGYGARMTFEAFAVAGSFIGYQMGMAIMNVFDPTTQEQTPIIGNFWLLIIVVFFLVTNSHYYLVGTLFQNFKMIKLAGISFHASAGQALVRGGSMIYELALRFAAPTMFFLLMIDVALAFMARVMPQLNIFFISLPLKIGAGIILLILSLQIFQTLFSYVIQELQGMLATLLRSF